MRTATLQFSKSDGSLNGPDLFTELPFLCKSLLNPSFTVWSPGPETPHGTLPQTHPFFEDTLGTLRGTLLRILQARTLRETPLVVVGGWGSQFVLVLRVRPPGIEFKWKTGKFGRKIQSGPTMAQKWDLGSFLGIPPTPDRAPNPHFLEKRV